MPPKQLAHYEILAPLGAGGMGEVYRARDTRLDREVALKILPADLARDPQRRNRFESEAKAVAALNHPHIVTMFSIEEADGERFLTMELVPGTPLGDLIPEDGMEPGVALDLAVQLTDALAAVHEKGITHRDLKPSNIMVTPAKQVKVLDFGVAKVKAPKGAAAEITDAPTLTATGVIVGTVAYMSPEQLEGGVADHRSDIFSLGIVLYRMLTGALPFRGDNHAALMSAILRDTPAPVTRHRPELPKSFDAILSRCLEKDPEARYGSMTELQADLEALRVGSAPAARPAAARAGERTIAVLPFTDMSPGGEQEYFCDGITEEIINALVAVPGLKVAARTSSFAHKGAEQDVRTIGEALGVAQVLEGSVRTAGRRLRVTAQLINVSDGYHVWSGKYDRDLEDVFAVQDEISAAIVEALQMTMGEGERPKAAARHSQNMEAYQLYLRGRYCWNRRGKGVLPQAIGYFRQAIDADPTYALAYSGLADCYNVMGFFAYDRPGTAYTRARAAAQRALEIDPHLAEAHCSLGYVLHHFDRDWPAMESAYQRAIELKPEYSVAHQWFSLGLAILGKREEAKASVLRARELDPLSPVINAAVGWVHHFCGEPERAVRELLEVAMPLVPEFAWMRVTLGEALMALGRTEEAEGHFRFAVDNANRITFALGNLGHCLAVRGDTLGAEAILAELTERSGTEYVSHYSFALVQTGLGRWKEARTSLEDAVIDRDALASYIAVDPRFHGEELAIGDLLVRMGLGPEETP